MRNTSARLGVWRALYRGLFVAALLLIFANVGLWYKYAQTRPISPDASVGRTHALNTHGRIVYLTLAEQLKLLGLQSSAVLCVAASMVAYLVNHNTTERSPYGKL